MSMTAFFQRWTSAIDGARRAGLPVALLLSVLTGMMMTISAVLVIAAWGTWSMVSLRVFQAAPAAHPAALERAMEGACGGYAEALVAAHGLNEALWTTATKVEVINRHRRRTPWAD